MTEVERLNRDRSLVLTVREAANALACSEAHIRSLIDAGDLPAIRIGDGKRSPYRVTRKGLEDYIACRLDHGARARVERVGAKTNGRSGSSASWALSFSESSFLGEPFDG
ncbi:MAG: helix-turn-helix domain-containing protein [Solirubrobacterales bacterium]